MGLFGGFKAKFSREPTRKSSNKNEVVCLGYRIRSEFDDLPQNNTATIKTSSPNIQTYKPTEQNKRIIPPESLPSSSSNIPSSQKPTKKRVPHIPKPIPKEDRKELAKDSTKTSVHLNGIDNNSRTNNDKPSNSKSENTKLTYVTGKTSSFTPIAKKETKSILKVAPPPPNNKIVTRTNNVIEESTTESKNKNNYHFAYTKQSEENGNKVTSTGSLTASRFVTENHTAEIATFVQTEVTENTVTNNNYSIAPSATSYRGYGQTSSQAASIFFDGDDEPVIEQRPRRINIETDDDRRSSADC